MLDLITSSKQIEVNFHLCKNKLNYGLKNIFYMTFATANVLFSFYLQQNKIYLSSISPKPLVSSQNTFTSLFLSIFIFSPRMKQTIHSYLIFEIFTIRRIFVSNVIIIKRIQTINSF